MTAQRRLGQGGEHKGEGGLLWLTKSVLALRWRVISIVVDAFALVFQRLCVLGAVFETKAILEGVIIDRRGRGKHARRLGRWHGKVDVKVGLDERVFRTRPRDGET